MYSMDLKAVLHRRASFLLLESTNTESSHPSLPQMVPCFHEFHPPWHICLLPCIPNFSCTFLGLWISTAPRTMRNLSWTCVIWGNSTTSEDTHTDLWVNELLLPHCSLSSHEPLSLSWTFETWQLSFALLVVGSDCPGRDPEPAHHMQWDILCISFRVLGSQVSTKEIGFGNTLPSSRANAWIFLFLTRFSVSSRGYFNSLFLLISGGETALLHCFFSKFTG